MASQTSLERWDKKFLWHPFTQQYLWERDTPLIIKAGRGPYLIDVAGKRYLDGVSSLWVNLQGHNNSSLNKAVRAQLSKIAHSTFLGLSHPPAIRLGRELARVAPKGLTRTFYSDNGATAVEVALKMAFQYWLEKNPKRRSIRSSFLAVKGSYHGDTIGAVSVGSIGAFHSKFKPLLFKSRFAMAPHCARCPYNRAKTRHVFRTGETITRVPKPGVRRQETGCRWECLGDVERILRRDKDRIAAVVIEPVVQGAGGMIVMPPGYVAGLARLIRQAGILLIADEVATGFGRTGTLFALQQERVRPDFLCLAKALTGGYSPLAATMVTERIYRAFWGPVSRGRTFFHGHSYTAHPLGAAAALENLKLIQRKKLLEKTRRMAKLMKNELMRLIDLPHVGSVRQAGLMVGVELVKKKSTMEPFPSTTRLGARVCRRLLAHGLWLRPLGDVIVMMPPPILSASELRWMVRSVSKAIDDETKS